VKNWYWTTWFRTRNFKPWLESGIFRYISWMNSSFLGVMIGIFLERKSPAMTYINAPLSPVNSQICWSSFHNLTLTLQINKPRIDCTSRAYCVHSIDCRCDDGRLLASASWLASDNPASLSSCETGVSLGIRSWKSAYLKQLNVSKSLVASISQKCEDLRL
jgi:hypothetical protein